MAIRCVRRLKKCCGSLVSVLRIIFTFGDVRASQPDLVLREVGHPTPRSDTDPYDPPRYNGLISSVEFFILFMTFAFCVLLSPIMSKSEDGDNLLVHSVLICFMLAGFIVIVGFHRYDRVLQKRNAKTISMKGRLTLAGVVVFYIFSCILDFLYFIALVKCTSSFRIFGGRKLVNHAVSITFHISRVCYLGAETVACIVFGKSHFLDRISARYGIMILQAANLVLWFDILLRESSERLNGKNNRPINSSLYADLNMSLNDKECLYGNSSFQLHVENNISPYLYPFPYEFSILMGECIMKWFTQCSSPAEKVRELTAQPSEPEVERSEAMIESSTNQSTHPDIDHRCETDSYTESTPLVSNRPITYSLASLIAFLLGITINLIHGILCFVARKNERAYFIYSSFYFTSIVVAVGLGYYCSTAFRGLNTRKKFGSLDYLLLVSTVGPFFYSFTVFFAIFCELDKDYFETKYFIGPTGYFIWELSFCLSVFIQIPFSFLVGRVVVPESTTSRSQRIKLAAFKAIVLHLAICNGSMWFVSTFSTSDTTDNVYIQHLYFDRIWNILDIFMLPLVLFFRFNSSIMFTCAYFRMTKLFRNS